MSITTISSTGGIITTNLITCQSCTFENEPTCTRCVMCRTVLARGQSPPARSSTCSSGPKWKSRRSKERFKWRNRTDQSRGRPLQTFAKKCKVCANTDRRYVPVQVLATVWLHSTGNWKHDQQKLYFFHFDSYHVMCRYSSIRQRHPLLQAKRGHCRNYLANNHISQMLSSFSPLPCVRTHTGLPPSARPNREGLVYP